jgi:lysophospholipase L1-like esterase
VLAMVKPGDFVMMQFGHNDNGSPTNPPPGRTSIKGTGDETLDVVDPATGKHETVHTFGWYIRKYISDTRAKGATPIVCSLIPRKTWKDGKMARAKDTHAGWAETAAKSEHAPFIDLNEIIAERYDALGPAKVDPLFADGHTHTTADGAVLNAQCVVAGLKMLADDPLAPYLK